MSQYDHNSALVMHPTIDNINIFTRLDITWNAIFSFIHCRNIRFNIFLGWIFKHHIIIFSMILTIIWVTGTLWIEVHISFQVWISQTFQATILWLYGKARFLYVVIMASIMFIWTRMEGQKSTNIRQHLYRMQNVRSIWEDINISQPASTPFLGQ
jgi:hypothetical protein